MLGKVVSMIVPFYNPPQDAFQACLLQLEALRPCEVILVDDCSNKVAVTTLAKKSGFTYLKTPYQSGHDGLPFNLGVAYAKGDYRVETYKGTFFPMRFKSSLNPS